MRVEAELPGPAGNAISIEYVAIVAGQASTVITVNMDAITVYPGAKARMNVTGSLTSNGVTPITFTEIPFTEMFNGRPVYEILGGNSCAWDGLKWILYHAGSGVEWHSYDDVLTPDLATAWVPVFGSNTGTPILIASASSAAQVIAALEADPVATVRIVSYASGTVTGAVAATGLHFLQGGSSALAAHLGLEGVTGFTRNPNGAWSMTPTGPNTLTFPIAGATGSETYIITTARVLSELDDFGTGDVLASCLFSDPSSNDAEFVMLAFGVEVQKVKLADGTITRLTLPGTTTLDGEISMIQAMDKVLLFRAGKVALQWIAGASAFTAVPSGIYTQPQIITSAGSGISATDGLVTFTVVGNSTIDRNDQLTIYSATDARFLTLVGQSFTVASISGSTIIRCYIPIPNSASGSNSVQIGRPISLGGGYIYQPAFPWAIYFQRRLWGLYRYFWDVSLTPDAFTSRAVTDELIAGDILDTDTFDPLANQFRITGGTADHIVALHPFFDDTLLILNRNSIHAISGTVGSLLDTTVREMTREIGCLARKSVITHGDNVFFLSDNGVYGLEFEDLYNLRGIERPLSEKIQPYIDRISHKLASGAVAAYHDNRYWLAVPLDSVPRHGDAIGNNVILVYNLLNSEWESVDTFNDPHFLITDFIVATAGGRKDLHAVTSAGGIHVMDKLDQDYDRIATNPTAGATRFAIDALLQSRGFMGGTSERKRFASLGVQMKSGNAQSDIGVSFVTDDPDATGAETLASVTMAGPLAAENSADVRLRVGGMRGFTGIVTVRREIGRPRIRGIKVNATLTNQATLTQK